MKDFFKTIGAGFLGLSLLSSLALLCFRYPVYACCFMGGLLIMLLMYGLGMAIRNPS